MEGKKMNVEIVGWIIKYSLGSYMFIARYVFFKHLANECQNFISNIKAIRMSSHEKVKSEQKLLTMIS
ncbi:CLUMA_CG018433, isoform A [Clunio marinus]|uniref:CLUMA_CG018433, isoform A n=1 Tax=Clunio marinus TaxID=568069 RepID=A0A1J1IXZ6_9DIPT|nr:CLUMA_CG018433, isoform A [Clunio marinus]